MNKNYLPFYNSLNDKEKSFWLDCTKEELIDHLIANINKGAKLLNRINKAIEYIKEYWKKHSFYESIENCMTFCEFDKEDLLEILGGEQDGL